MGKAETDRYLAAAMRLREGQPRRAVPSPSSVMDCRRRTWFSGTGVEVDNYPDNGESFIAAESGKATEGVLTDIAEEAGFGKVVVLSEKAREIDPEVMKKYGMRGGQIDRLIEVDGSSQAPKGYTGLAVLELKRKGAFDIIDLIRRGSLLNVMIDKPESYLAHDYVQLQVYMGVLGIEMALYIAANWDRGGFTNSVRYAKDFNARPDAVHIEWLPFDVETFNMAVARGVEVGGYIDTVREAGDVPRDYDPQGKRFPCSWCPYLGVCREAGG